VAETIVITATDPNSKTGVSSSITVNSGIVTITRLALQPDGSMKLIAHGVPGQTYQIQAAATLAAPVSWATIGSSVAATDGVITFTDADAANHSCRYYRVAAP